MRIGVDGLLWTHPRGVGHFARNIVRRLVELDTEHDYELIVAAQHAGKLADPPDAPLRAVALDDVRTRVGKGRTLGDRRRLFSAVRAGRFEVFLFPMIDSVYFVGGVPTVVGVADAITNRPPPGERASLYAKTVWPVKRAVALRRASRVFTISEAARAPVARKFRLPPDDVAVVPGAPDPVFRPTDGAPGEPFLLCMSGLSPRKNLDVVFDAYTALRARPGGVPPLVILGPNASGRRAAALADVHARIERRGLAADVRLPGYVDDSELARLYTAADAVIVATLDEGYGLPAVEAAACGAALVLSDLPAHRETMGDAPLFIRPDDPAALAGAVGDLLDDAELAQTVRARCRDAVSETSWDEGARALAGLLVEAARDRRRSVRG